MGFEVAKPLIERTFLRTYSLEVKDVSGTFDLAIGTYRRTVSGLIPKMTKVAWTLKKDEIVKSQQEITREKFLYNLSRADYEKTWGTEYRRPGIGSQLLAFVIRIVPKIGHAQVSEFFALQRRKPKNCSWPASTLRSNVIERCLPPKEQGKRALRT